MITSKLFRIPKGSPDTTHSRGAGPFRLQSYPLIRTLRHRETICPKSLRCKSLNLCVWLLSNTRWRVSWGTRVVEIREGFPKEVGIWVGPKEGIQPPCQVGEGHAGQRWRHQKAWWPQVTKVMVTISTEHSLWPKSCSKHSTSIICSQPQHY